MAWLKYEIVTSAEAEDIVASVLYDHGITSVEIKDKVPVPPEELDGVFTEILPDEPEDDGVACITFYIDEDAPDKEELRSNVARAVEELKTDYPAYSFEFSESRLDNDDWAHNWKKHWHTIQINDLYIKPSWEEVTPEMEGKKVLSLDPGTAFGTGGHETTRLCITGIQKYLKPGDCVLDIGCGSGILTIVAGMYGAGTCLGTDLDKIAIIASEENYRENADGDERDVKFVRGNIVTDEAFKAECGFEKYDLVLANILPEVLVPLSESVDTHMKPGAYLIYSGILLEKEEQVKKAIEKNDRLDIIETLYDGEWLAIVSRKKVNVV